MNAIANVNVYKNEENFLLGVDVGRAEGKKQQGSSRWVGRLCAWPQIERVQERKTRKLCQEYTSDAPQNH